MTSRKRSASRSSTISSSASSNSISSEDEVLRKKNNKKKATRTKKRQRVTDDEKKPAIDPHEDFLAAARCIARCVDMFCKMKQLINVGLALQAADTSDVSGDEGLNAARDKRLSNMSLKVQERFKRNFARLLQLAPDIKPLLGDPRKASELNVIIKKMDATISATRSDDTSRLKNQIGHYAAYNPRVSTILPPIYDGSGSRTHLGINHPVLAQFLCPVRELKEFSKDADKALKKLQNGKITMTASALPAFLWAGDPPGQDYDDDNMFEGMFEGYLLERTMRHIFTSPSSAYGGETRATRTCNAVLHDMTTVEAAHIAYGCLQVRFGISAKNAWAETDGAFNYRDFYTNIMDLIENSPDPEWKEELLKGWNVKLFKNEEGRDGNSNAIRDSDMSSSAREGQDDDLARVHAQMAARLAAKAVQGPPPPPDPQHQPSPTPVPPPTDPHHQPSPTPAPPPSGTQRQLSPTPAPPPPSDTQRQPLRPPSTLPARLARPAAVNSLTPERAESRASSDLTVAASDEDSEPVKINKASTKGKKKRKGPDAVTTKTRKSSRKR